MGEYYCTICHSYHDSTSCCPTNIQTLLVNPKLNGDSDFSLNWRLDKIITLLEQLLQEVRNK